MAHDEEAIRCITTSLRTLEFGASTIEAEDSASIILSALAAEGLYVVRE
jgi:hypothetical protein